MSTKQTAITFLEPPKLFLTSIEEYVYASVQDIAGNRVDYPLKKRKGFTYTTQMTTDAYLLFLLKIFIKSFTVLLTDVQF